jgi:hypothetical protein
MIDRLRETATEIRAALVKRLRRRRLIFLGWAFASSATGVTFTMLTRSDDWWHLGAIFLLLTIWFASYAREAVRPMMAVETEIETIDGHLAALDDTPEILNTVTLAQFMTHVYPRTEAPRHAEGDG